MNNSYSQDVHYSQRLAGDRQNNPTFLNHFEGNWQAMTVYRQQWQSIGVPFNSTGLFFTKKISGSFKSLNFFGSLLYTNDKSGDAKLNSNHISLTAGAEYTLEENKFSLGFSNALVAKRFDESGLTFPSQYDRNTGGFNGNLDNGENFNSENLNYYDLNVGLMWQRRFSNGWNLTSGFSIAHVTEPVESFLQNDNRKNRGYGLQFLGKKQLQNHITIFPYVSFYRAKGASETLIGSAIALKTSSLGIIDEIKPFAYFRTGIDRLTDAFVLGTSAKFRNIEAGISYDVNISELEFASNYQGGFELTLLYTAPELKLTKRRIPCERY